MISLFHPTRDRNKGRAGRFSRSASLARQVRDRLRAAGYLALRDVSCEVRNGLAFLDGQLRSQYLKQIALAVAMGVEGIVGIENRINVIPVTVVANRRRSGAPIRPDMN